MIIEENESLFYRFGMKLKSDDLSASSSAVNRMKISASSTAEQKKTKKKMLLFVRRLMYRLLLLFTEIEKEFSLHILFISMLR